MGVILLFSFRAWIQEDDEKNKDSILDEICAVENVEYQNKQKSCEMSNHYRAYFILLKKTWSWNIQTAVLLALWFFLMYHVIAVTKLKIVNWWPKRPKSKTFTKLFGLLGTENLMNGSKMWRLFTLKEHKYKFFLLMPQFFLINT